MAWFGENSKGIFIMATRSPRPLHPNCLEPNRETAGLKGKQPKSRTTPMNRIIYVVGLIVIVLAILSFIGIA
ncbi:MAG: hypothetical protein MRY75_12385 [Marivita sp.]|uniref:hypothetical protein n=1 Tax=Marivita sp. TaxID=2003365 RepID=UPI0025C6DE86|nr:hypothetical protein [Marivita sp.]MCI5111341.1 hypothetical protein [Marivita sp.]